jgi:hypothetical protein
MERTTGSALILTGAIEMKNRRILAAVAAFVSLSAGGVGLASSSQATEDQTSATAQVADFGDLRIVNNHAHKCVDVTDAATVAGEVLQEWDCTGVSEQVFRPIDVGNGFIHLYTRRNLSLCMTVSSADVRRVYQDVCQSGVPGQWWRWEVANNTGALVLVSGFPGLCLGLIPNTSKNGTPIFIIPCSGTDSADLWHTDLV